MHVALLLLASLLRVPTADSVGLLIVAHGADSAWNSRVTQTAAAVQWQGPVRTAFLMGPSSRTQGWNQAVDELVAAGARRIIVVPLMVSSNGSHVRQIEHYAGVRAELPPELAGAHAEHGAMTRPSVPTIVTRAIDSAPELGEIMAARWHALDAVTKRRPVVVIAHGPNADADVQPWIEGLDTGLAALTRALGDKPMRIGLLRDDAPAPVRASAIASLRDSITRLAGGDSVTVMTVLISSGSIDRVKIPNDLQGLPVRYVGVTLAPHPALSRWIERTARATAAGSLSGTRTSGHNH